MKGSTGEPTLAMWQALVFFRKRHGRYWKRALTDRWLNGMDIDDPHGSSLRAVRNLLGPAWLYRVTSGRLDATRDRLEERQSALGLQQPEEGRK